MKEIVDVSVAGIAFKLELEAYEALKKYLDKIGQLYGDDQHRVEIVNDIEARVCELLLDAQDSSTPVSGERIRGIIQQLGHPEELEPDSNQKTQSSSNEQDGLVRRLYRNPDGAKFGGVCSGLATYFNVEVVLLRLSIFIPLLLALLLDTLHMSFLSNLFMGLFPATCMLYILLWFSVPKARTPRQRLEMQGKGVTLSNIKQQVHADFEDISSSSKNQRTASLVTEFLYVLSRMIIFILKFVAVLFAFACIIASIASVVCIVMVFYDIETSSLPIPYFLNPLLGSTPSMATLFFFVAVCMAFCLVLWNWVLDRPFPKRTLFVMGLITGLLFLFILLRGGYEKKSENQNFHIPPSAHVVDSCWVERIVVKDSVYWDTVRMKVIQ